MVKHIYKGLVGTFHNGTYQISGKTVEVSHYTKPLVNEYGTVFGTMYTFVAMWPQKPSATEEYILSCLVRDAYSLGISNDKWNQVRFQIFNLPIKLKGVENA